MSKERLEEANKWLVRIKSLSTTKSNKEDAEYVNKHAEILEGLIEQNKRYREIMQAILDYNHIKLTVPIDVIKLIESELGADNDE